MLRPPILVLALALTLAGCASAPFELSDRDWQSLSLSQKVELRWRWLALQQHPPAAILSSAPNSNATAALVELKERNLELARQLDESRRTVARLEQEIAAARTGAAP